MSDYRVLDLFCGLGGFSQAFEESERWDVTTVDLEGDFDPDITADVFDLRPSDFDNDFDVVLASPPCTEFSLAQNMNQHDTPDGDHVALAFHTLGVIRGLRPTFWFVENPRGRLRNYLGRPNETVTYCQYGEKHMKPTDLWGVHPSHFIGRSCNYGDECHINHRDGSNVMRDDLGKSDAAARSALPYELSASIRNACESALDGTVPKQTSLVGEEWSV